MDILIISHFGDSYSNTDNDRFLYLAKELCEKYSVEIVTSSFLHSRKKHRRMPEEKWPFKISFVEEPGYKKNICIKRFASHFVWGINLYRYLKEREKPDVIYCAVPSLTGPALSAHYCKRNNVRFIIDVQDVWPEAFKLIFNIPIVSGLIFLPFTLIARNIYKNANYICAVSNTYAEIAKKHNSIAPEPCVVYLGTDLASFDNNAQNNLTQTNEKTTNITYGGTLGASYDIKSVIDAIDLLNENIELHVYGDGPEKEFLEEYSKKKDVSIQFHGRVTYDRLCGALYSSDIVVNPIKKNAAGSIINKHADYAAAGKPVINTQENKEYKDLIEKYNMGINCECQNPKDIASKIKRLIDDRSLQKTMGKNSRKCAEELFDRKQTYKKIIALIGE